VVIANNNDDQDRMPTRKRKTRKRKTRGGRTAQQVLTLRRVGKELADLSAKRAQNALASWKRRQGLA